jgi:hypothetical protein
LHLEAGTYLVYDYWNNRLIGETSSRVELSLQSCASTVLAVHKKLDRPQFLSSSRHISQGAMDLLDLSWDKERSTLKGKSLVVKNDPYEITVYRPESWVVFVETNDTTQMEWKNDGHLSRLKIIPKETGEWSWAVQFAR